MSDKLDSKIVVGYVRVSTSRQAEKGQSLKAQASKIRAYAKLSGLKLDRIFEERGLSGKSTDRPALSELRELLPQIGTVIVYKFDRISRSVVDLYQLLEEFSSHGVEFRSVSEGIDTGNAIGRFMVSIMASLAQMERELIAERTRDTLASKKARGEHIGRIPFGYQISESGKLVRNAVEQKTIAKIRRLRRQGRSYRDIAGRTGVNYRTVANLVS